MILEKEKLSFLTWWIYYKICYSRLVTRNPRLTESDRF